MEEENKEEQAIKSYISEIKNVLIVLVVAICSKLSAFICVHLRLKINHHFDSLPQCPEQ